ncbi:DUF305 domain-containing protein [Pararhizobium sp. DWP3-4]|uniref:DUF305 domain-containing protein n=1 Tax=unclassified Pararhizobium TaxID=2643050 RepID=UPI003CED0E61
MRRVLPVLALLACATPAAGDQINHHAHAGSTDQPPTTPFSMSMRLSMSKMHSAMMSAPQSGIPERDFLEQMLPHHRGAVDMAKAVLLATSDMEIRNLAQSIVTEQEYEIQLMTIMLEKMSARVSTEGAAR